MAALKTALQWGCACQGSLNAASTHEKRGNEEEVEEHPYERYLAGHQRYDSVCVSDNIKLC
jgi:hypothetical protein